MKDLQRHPSMNPRPLLVTMPTMQALLLPEYIVEYSQQEVQQMLLAR